MDPFATLNLLRNLDYLLLIPIVTGVFAFKLSYPGDTSTTNQIIITFIYAVITKVLMQSNFFILLMILTGMILYLRKVNFKFAVPIQIVIAISSIYITNWITTYDDIMIKAIEPVTNIIQINAKLMTAIISRTGEIIDILISIMITLGIAYIWAKFVRAMLIDRMHKMGLVTLTGEEKIVDIMLQKHLWHSVEVECNDKIYYCDTIREQSKIPSKEQSKKRMLPFHTDKDGNISLRPSKVIIKQVTSANATNIAGSNVNSSTPQVIVKEHNNNEHETNSRQGNQQSHIAHQAPNTIAEIVYIPKLEVKRMTIHLRH